MPAGLVSRGQPTVVRVAASSWPGLLRRLVLSTLRVVRRGSGRGPRLRLSSLLSAPAGGPCLPVGTLTRPRAGEQAGGHCQQRPARPDGQWPRASDLVFFRRMGILPLYSVRSNARTVASSQISGRGRVICVTIAAGFSRYALTTTRISGRRYRLPSYAAVSSASPQLQIRRRVATQAQK
jgi:hypothetical protein